MSMETTTDVILHLTDKLRTANASLDFANSEIRRMEEVFEPLFPRLPGLQATFMTYPDVASPREVGIIEIKGRTLRSVISPEVLYLARFPRELVMAKAQNAARAFTDKLARSVLDAYEPLAFR